MFCPPSRAHFLIKIPPPVICHAILYFNYSLMLTKFYTQTGKRVNCAVGSQTVGQIKYSKE
jgi:hypothetical protein